MATKEFHTDTSRRFIEQAEDELRLGDGLQASEKAWGAAAHAVKSIAEREGWRHDKHSDLFRAVDNIVNRTGDPEIRNLFSVANSLHQNFYEGWFSDPFIASNIEDVKRLLDKLDRA